MKDLLKWIKRQWQQNVIGISPPPAHTTWGSLSKQLSWRRTNTPVRKQHMLDRLKEEFNDETSLMFQTFAKLMGMLTVVGLMFALGGNKLPSQPTFMIRLALLPAGIAVIFTIWGLSTRFKVMKKMKDSSIDALVVRDGLGGQGEPIVDPYAADIWYYYQWKWHRHCTRLAIDRLFLIVCVLLAVTVAVGVATLM